MLQIHLNQETYMPAMPALFGAVTDTAVRARPPAQAWFAGGERVGYDPTARTIVGARDTPLKIFLRREGDVAHAITFLRDFPMVRSGGLRFCRIYQTQPRCRNSSSNMSAWVIATSPRTTPIPPTNAPISSKRY